MDNKNFVCSPETGRFKIYSERTGMTYYIESIGTTRTNWGDINPATKQVEGSYGNKMKGSIDEKESVLTEENGFINVTTLPVGTDPISYVEQLDAKYPDKKN